MRATTIRGANAFDVTLRFTQIFANKIDHGHKCALLKFHLTDDQNMRALSTSDNRRVWNANTVTCLPMSIICIRDTIISSTHTFMSGPSMNILTYFPYIRSPLTNILRAYCDIRSVFFIISRAFVDMYSARFTMCCQNFVICGSFSYRLALSSLRLTACGP